MLGKKWHVQQQVGLPAFHDKIMNQIGQIVVNAIFTAPNVAEECIKNRMDSLIGIIRSVFVSTIVRMILSETCFVVKMALFVLIAL